MTRPFSLQPLLEIMQNRADEATRRLGTLIAQERNAKQQLTLLEGYREDYAQRFRLAAEAGLSPRNWANYQEFLARIDEAIRQQRANVQHSEHNTAAGQARWQEQNKRLKAIDTLAERHLDRERYRENRLDQKAHDELAARRPPASE